MTTTESINLPDPPPTPHVIARPDIENEARAKISLHRNAIPCHSCAKTGRITTSSDKLRHLRIQCSLASCRASLTPHAFLIRLHDILNISVDPNVLAAARSLESPPSQASRKISNKRPAHGSPPRSPPLIRPSGNDTQMETSDVEAAGKSSSSKALIEILRNQNAGLLEQLNALRAELAASREQANSRIAELTATIQALTQDRTPPPQPLAATPTQGPSSLTSLEASIHAPSVESRNRKADDPLAADNKSPRRSYAEVVADFGFSGVEADKALHALKELGRRRRPPS
jgi:hypothetical protein